MKRYSLTSCGSGSWLPQLLTESEEAAILCEVLGAPFLGLALISGLRIHQVALEPHNLVASQIACTFDEEGAEEVILSVQELRQRLVRELEQRLSLRPRLSLPAEPSLEQLSECIGIELCFAAPYLNIAMRELSLSNEEAQVEFLTSDEEALRWELQAFQQMLIERLRQQVDAGLTRPKLTPDQYQQLEEAQAQEQWQLAVDILYPWYLRLSAHARVGKGVRAGKGVRFAKGVEQGGSELAPAEVEHLELLAFSLQKLELVGYAEIIMRGALQLPAKAEAKAHIFRGLGVLLLEQKRAGEALGYLRRALSLGFPSKDILPDLAKCLADRRRFVAAAGCLERARSEGADAQAVNAALALVRDNLDTSGWRTLIASFPSLEDASLPPWGKPS